MSVRDSWLSQISVEKTRDLGGFSNPLMEYLSLSKKFFHGTSGDLRSFSKSQMDFPGLAKKFSRQGLERFFKIPDGIRFLCEKIFSRYRVFSQKFSRVKKNFSDENHSHLAF